MKAYRLLRHIPLSAAVLLAITPSASAVDFSFSSGTYVPGTTAPEPLVTGQVLQIDAGGNKFFSSATFTNQSGLVNWNADSLFMQNGALINNQSVWDAKSDNALVNNGGPLSTFANSGTFRKSGGPGTASIGAIAFVNSGIIDAQTGTITFGGGNATFNAGSQFIGAGSTVVSNNASFNGAFTASNLTLSAGSFTGSATQINGSVNFSGGLLQGGWEVAGGQSLVGTSGANKFLNGAALTNNGTVSWQTGNSLFLQNGASFTNNALHDIQVSSAMVNNGGPLSSYTNSSGATLRVAAGQAASIGSIAFVNNGGMLTANGTLSFAGGNATFGNGTAFNGGGTNLITNNASFNGVITSSNLVLQGGTYSGSAAVLIGSVDLTGGLLTGAWELGGGQVINGKDGANKFLSSASFTNQGSVQWQSSNSLFLQNGSSFDNQGAFDMLTGMALVNNGGPLSSFTNSGTLHVATGQSGNVGSIAFVNNGGNLASDGTLTFSGGNATFNPGTRFTGAGIVTVNNNATFNGGQLSTNLSLRNGAFTGNGAMLNGSAELSGGLLQGSWTIAGGATLNGVDGSNKFLNGGTLTNQGTLTWKTSNTLFFQNGANLANQGTIDLQTDSAMIFNGGAAGTFINTGLIIKTGGPGISTIGNNLGFDNQGVVHVSTGTIRLPDNFTNNGTLKGAGTFATNVLTNAGHVAPGNSPGTLTLNGNYVQTAAGFLDTELVTSTLFDTFLINGTAKLDGTLALSCVLSCALHDGDVFVILDSTADLTGTFANVIALNFGIGFQYDVIYDYNADLVKLAVIHAPVPEPETWALLIVGLGAMGAIVRRRRARDLVFPR